MSLFLYGSDDVVECPTCGGSEGHCERCHGRGFIKTKDLKDGELALDCYPFPVGDVPDEEDLF